MVPRILFKPKPCFMAKTYSASRSPAWVPTIGPILFQSLVMEDMFLASSTIMITTALTLIGTLISDILLAWLDPRIRYA